MPGFAGAQIPVEKDAGGVVPNGLQLVPVTRAAAAQLSSFPGLAQRVRYRGQGIAIGDIQAHEADVAHHEQVSLLVVGHRVVHGAVVEAGLEDSALSRAYPAVVEIARLILAVAAPGEVSLDVAMLGPPAILLEQRCEGFLEKPAVAELVIEPQGSN